MDCVEPGLSVGQWEAHQEFQNWVLLCPLTMVQAAWREVCLLPWRSPLLWLASVLLELSLYFFFFFCKTFTFSYSWLGYKLLSPERIHLCSATIYWLSSKQKQFAFLWAFHFTNIQNDTLKEKLMYTHLEAQTRCSRALGALGSPSDQDQRYVNSVLMRL